MTILEKTCSGIVATKSRVTDASLVFSFKSIGGDDEDIWSRTRFDIGVFWFCCIKLP